MERIKIKKLSLKIIMVIYTYICTYYSFICILYYIQYISILNLEFRSYSNVQCYFIFNRNIHTIEFHN